MSDEMVDTDYPYHILSFSNGERFVLLSLDGTMIRSGFGIKKGISLLVGFLAQKGMKWTP